MNTTASAVDTRTVNYVIHIAATPETVWSALTGADALRQNWGRIESDWTTGSRVLEKDDAGKVLWSGTVRRSDPPRLLSYTFDVTGSGEPPTEVTFELGPPVSPTVKDAAVVQLRLTQSGFRPDSAVMPGCARAWPEILSSIKSYVETGRGLGFAWEH
jgi:uncharacterized protein YndB with AHSA1/START domain